MTAHVTGFDTLAYARRLKAAGVDERQAEAHAEAVRDAVTEGVAAKADLDKGLAAVKADIARLEVKIDAIADRLMLRLGGLVIAVGGLIVAAIKLLPQVAP